MKFSKSVLVATALLCAHCASGFATMPSTPKASSTSLGMINGDGVKKAATSLVAAAFLMSNAAMVDTAFAMEETDFGSSQVIAARSGGRAGGRSSGARRAPVSRAPTSSSRTVIQRNTFVAPPVYSTPGIMVAPPMYNPLPGLGFSLGLNAMSNMGNDMRDYRQEGEIRDTRSELMRSQAREAEMEARLKQLEMQQQGQLTLPQQQLLMQQQTMMQQQAK